MADQKISELTALTGANVADDDAIAIVDTSATETKKIVFSELKNALDTATGFVRITGDTMTGALDVQSTITADGLTVDGNATLQSTAPILNIVDTDGQSGRVRVTSSAMLIEMDPSAAGVASNIQFKVDNKQFLNIDDSGDISFYEDTGTTAKFFWDASAERLGIGTSSPSEELHVKASAATIRIEDNVGSWDLETDTNGSGIISINDATKVLRVFTGGSESMRIDASGNVGIGTSSPRAQIDFAIPALSSTLSTTNSDYQIMLEAPSGTNNYAHNIGWSESTGSAVTVAAINAIDEGSSSATGITFATGNNSSIAERMRIDSSGNVGIGTTSPDYPLHVKGTSNILKLETSTNSRTQLGGYDASGNANFLVGSNDSTNTEFWNYKNGYMRFATNSTERMRIDASGNLLVGTTSYNADNTGFGVRGSDGLTYAARPNGQPLILNRKSSDGSLTSFRKDGVEVGSIASVGGSDIKVVLSSDGDQYITGNAASNYMTFSAANAERMRIDSSGNLLVGKTTSSFATAGTTILPSGNVTFTRSNAGVVDVNRLSSDGSLINLYKDGSSVGGIGTQGGDLNLGTGDTGLYFQDGADSVIPWNFSSNTIRDNAIDLGSSAYRFDDIYATNGTIQTSDRNEKQDIAELSDAEQRVAVAAKGLLRKFRWKDAVEAKGDEARTHFGIIAQDLQAAFAAEGLDAGDYAMFISSTWTDEETGEERTRMGVRYSELLAFIIAAI